ncbi:MAG: glycosyltransferase family 2 protein [Flavobacteriales bacterium]|nr:glycosyltransferase family 2 protein [Flavobacteriales bacterium]
MEIVLIIIYGLTLSFIFLYSIVQINLVINYLRNNKKEDRLNPIDKDALPFVTIQLPLYNELYVVERLIDSITKFDYPKDKFEIQILDDSTDETVEIVAKKVAEYKALGFNIYQHRRETRVGYKAGALKEGLEIAKGEFIAIFDADFLPKAEFLTKTLPYFKDEKIGVVQTKWEHLNKNYSLLTRLQAFGLDAHFTVEQTGRNFGNHFINFNGTAGIWRKSCIEDAGGWEADTLTEDLDLSYRAQLKGWKFKYLEELGSPAELPAAMNALKTQQFRWTKGAAECTRKNLLKVLKNKELPFRTKLHALFHLMNSSIFICIVLLSVLSIPMLMIKNNFVEYDLLFKLGSFFIISVIFLSVYYFVSLSSSYENKLKAFVHFILLFPLFLSVSMGLSLHNAIAVIEGYMGKKSPFIRTPKFNIIDSKDIWKKNKYLVSSVSFLTVFEFLLTIYFLFGILSAFHYNDFTLIPFHIMLFLGFGYVTFYSLFHSRKSIK